MFPAEGPAAGLVGAGERLRAVGIMSLNMSLEIESPGEGYSMISVSSHARCQYKKTYHGGRKDKDTSA